MDLDPETCHRALDARDPRFDGLFYVGVSTTGIYCRPVCPARRPGRDRCTFYARPAEAEKAGFRACFRCRPELAPGAAPMDATPRLVGAAVARIDAGFLNRHAVPDLAAALGVSERHLRRTLEEHLGVGPLELAATRRLALARQLLADTTLPITDIAFLAGYGSVRRFNAAFLASVGKPPSAARRPRTPAESTGVTAPETLALRLAYRPPFDWERLLAFLRGRRVAGVETMDDGVWRRGVVLEGHTGVIAVSPVPGQNALRVALSASLAPVLMPLTARLRALFDLDARPDVIAATLGADPIFAAAVAHRPGLRLPGAFDGWEMAVRAVLGQQVSVAAATTVCGRLVDRFGSVIPGLPVGIDRAFPAPAVLAAASESALCGVGMPGARARTLQALGALVAEGGVILEPGTPPEPTMAALEALPGIGPWTASYIAMRALRWPDAFPAGDLAVRKALGTPPPRSVLAHAESWRPWRAYAVVHLWHLEP